ncbi:hypothetical protein D3C74_289450 [compost metagenome]
MLFPRRNDVLGRAYLKFHIAHFVQQRIAPCIIDGFFDDLNPIHLIRMLGEEQRNCADATIRINYRFFAREPGIFDGFAIQHFCLYGIHLIKGSRGNRKLDVSNVIVDHITSPQYTSLVAKNNVCPLRIHVLAYTCHVWDMLTDTADPRIYVRNISPIRDEHQHHFTRAKSSLYNDMAQQPASGFFIICTDAEHSANLFHTCDNFVIAFILNETGIHIHNAMAATCIEAADKPAFGDTNRHLGFVAISPRLTHTECRRHDYAMYTRYAVGIFIRIHGRISSRDCIGLTICIRRSSQNLCSMLTGLHSHTQLPDTLQHIHDMLAFPAELRFVAHMLDLAATALIVDGARCCDPVRASLRDI